MKEYILTKHFSDRQVILKDTTSSYVSEREKPNERGLYYSNLCFKYKDAVEFVDYLYFLKFSITCIDLVDAKTEDYANGYICIDEYINETYLEYIERTYKEYRNWMWESDEFYYNFFFEYGCDIKNYPILDTSGQILYGKYINNCLYIDKEENNNIYNITMWNKDNNQDQKQFTFKTEKEVENFFRENNMIVKWES